MGFDRQAANVENLVPTGTTPRPRPVARQTKAFGDISLDVGSEHVTMFPADVGRTPLQVELAHPETVIDRNHTADRGVQASTQEGHHMKRTIPLLLVLILTLSACAGGAASDDTVQFSSDDAIATAEARDSDGGEVSDDAQAPTEEVNVESPGQRRVIQTAQIAIEADDTRAAFETIEDIVSRAGGFIESSNIADPGDEEEQPRINLVVRVPAADLPTALDGIAAAGARIVSESRQGQDVTEEYVDLEARITNLELLETELQALLTEVRQRPEADPAELLQVFNEVSRVRGEIEAAQGRKNLLDDLVSLATIQVSIEPTPESAPVISDDGWAPLGVFRDAVRSLVDNLQDVADVGIRFLVIGLPLLLLVVGLPGLILWWILKWYRNRQTRVVSTQAPPLPPTGEATAPDPDE